MRSRRPPSHQTIRPAPRLLGGSRRGFALQTHPGQTHPGQTHPGQTRSGEETRPTAVRARKALFDALAHRASLHTDFAAEEGSVWMLDAFAGSGALGLEALSRWQGGDQGGNEEIDQEGNKGGDEGGNNEEWHGVFFEHNAATAATLRDNVERSGFKARVLCRDAFAPHAARTHDERGKIMLAFFDPPYATSTEKAIRSPAAFAAQGWFAEGALVVLQRAAKQEPLLSLGEGFAPLGTLLSSSACFFFFRYATFDSVSDSDSDSGSDSAPAPAPA